MTIGEKVSYIKGLAEGLKVDESTNEGKVITAILDVLGEMLRTSLRLTKSWTTLQT